MAYGFAQDFCGDVYLCVPDADVGEDSTLGLFGTARGQPFPIICNGLPVCQSAGDGDKGGTVFDATAEKIVRLYCVLRQEFDDNPPSPKATRG